MGSGDSKLESYQPTEKLVNDIVSFSVPVVDVSPVMENEGRASSPDNDYLFKAPMERSVSHIVKSYTEPFSED